MFFVLMTFLSLLFIDLIENLTSFRLSGMSELSVAFVIGLAVTGMGIKEASTVHKTMIRIPTSKLPEGCDRLRIVQLTDLHLGPFVGLPLLAQILRKVRETDPDIVVVTGDLADGKLAGRRREIAMLKRIKPRFGMYAVPETMTITTISTRPSSSWNPPA